MIEIGAFSSPSTISLMSSSAAGSSARTAVENIGNKAIPAAMPVTTWRRSRPRISSVTVCSLIFADGSRCANSGLEGAFARTIRMPSGGDKQTSRECVGGVTGYSGSFLCAASARPSAARDSRINSSPTGETRRSTSSASAAAGGRFFLGLGIRAGGQRRLRNSQLRDRPIAEIAVDSFQHQGLEML